MYIGIRSIDPYEKEVIEKFGINYIPSQIINNNLEESICIIKSFVHNHPFHLSLDVDSLSSEIMPCTGTPVDNGIQFIQLRNLINHISSMQNLVNTDIVELNLTDMPHENGADQECLRKKPFISKHIKKYF